MSREMGIEFDTVELQKSRGRPWWKANWLNDFIIGAALPAIILAIWQFVSYFEIISPFFLPSPGAILVTFWELIASNELSPHLGISISRAAAGFIIGGSLGFLFGLLTGFSNKAEYVLDPSVQMLRMVPHLAIAPLIILWLGFGEASKVLIIAKGAFFPLYINTFIGIRNVDNKLFEVANILEFSRFKKIYYLILPSALPNILLGLRLSLALAWLGLVVAELLGSQAGIGFLINLGKQNSVPELIFMGIIIFAVLGKLVDSLVRILERKFLYWRDNYQG
ncbi:ABC transporter permease [Metabacillus fastidiosus]|uniref:ABC transporter permease n=2 Tax=Metabacillus fastidiosus TaxID=1458 RepID=A0ABU6NYX6_9BACI|nr:ABC transporter permease [Metabacillus fastidiosus]MED4402327.1 ABC transporter permease [Metabacillus fastidiosus]MED4454962.1 ABC transporter permease [Metabacillus fastidiosus]MED4462198.1 ABC transporter permease [Metabacillus fastidiosus]